MWLKECRVLHFMLILLSSFMDSSEYYVNGSNKFPNDFIFGVATSAYQTEGAWNVSNKGESTWDKMVHENPYTIDDQSNADIATNSYYMYKTDIDLAKQVGATAYRISISWPRILPDGFSNYINKDGIDYYNNVINEMLRQNITPYITLFHWDLPQKIQELGGWTNPLIVDWFVDFARVAFEAFGDRVKNWFTFNEPNFYCMFGYDGLFPPRVNQSGIASYICGHNALIAHAKTYRMYNEQFQNKQRGTVSLVVALMWFHPENVNDPDEFTAAMQTTDFWNSWFLNPIFSSKGDYSDLMKKKISMHSSIQGFRKSRLPNFTNEQIDMIRNSSDYLAINYYRSLKFVKWPESDIESTISFFADIGAQVNFDTEDDLLRRDSSLCSTRCTPWALTALIADLSKKYNNPKMLVTENGFRDDGHLDDKKRAEYYRLHFIEILKLINRGYEIKGYFAWSLIDVFEWTAGYTQKYGLFSVNFTDPQRPRTPKLWSTDFITQFYKTGIIPAPTWLDAPLPFKKINNLFM
ncbi:myrosinase 1-like [Microplitis mediator]|uniref:myrosinase 1-like n=1 Tax=Microplitis mediator TaxID=375433 RepID=UPI0025562C60|nr:myrosinase 1-like [Microplitis mediator]XP_057334313.1 myrosinase 1-like [Microplitis mediator]